MISESQLEIRLEQWVREYGHGGSMPHVSTRNFLQSLIDHKGFVPSKRGHVAVQLGTAADEVEAAVIALAQMRGEPGTTNAPFRAAMCLRAYYLSPKHWPEDERLRELSRAGLSISRQTFYRAVQYGREFLLQSLAQPRAAA
jgi:hypothetical protein